MAVHLRREIDELKQELLSLCALVEEQVQQAVQALVERNLDRARQVVQRDPEVDRREIEVEEECLKILALYQPVAIDLRLIVCVLKINNDLERIGDLAVNIAHKAITASRQPPIHFPFDLAGMAEQTQAMLRDSLDALVRFDVPLAEQILVRDDEIDRLKQEVRTWGEEVLQRDPARIKEVLALVGAARNLERIADHATNIAEDVIYIAAGRMVRHHIEG